MAKTTSSATTGSDNPEPVEVKLAEEGVYPEDYEDRPAQWKRAFDHAAKHNNTEKASVLYAEAHERDYEEGEDDGPTIGELNAEIKRLTAELAKAQKPAPKRKAK